MAAPRLPSARLFALPLQRKCWRVWQERQSKEAWVWGAAGFFLFSQYVFERDWTLLLSLSSSSFHFVSDFFFFLFIIHIHFLVTTKSGFDAWTSQGASVYNDHSLTWNSLFQFSYSFTWNSLFQFYFHRPFKWNFFVVTFIVDEIRKAFSMLQQLI